MIKKLTKHGNSYAIVIDKPILELLNAGADSQFEIITDGRSLLLTPIHSREEDDKFKKALADVHERFGNAMQRLAE